MATEKKGEERVMGMKQRRMRPEKTWEEEKERRDRIDRTWGPNAIKNMRRDEEFMKGSNDKVNRFVDNKKRSYS